MYVTLVVTETSEKLEDRVILFCQRLCLEPVKQQEERGQRNELYISTFIVTEGA